MEIKISPNDFPLIELDETPTDYDYYNTEDDDSADPLRDAG